MLIGEVSRRFGVPPKTLRYYEDIGLLNPPDRDQSGYRDYREAVLDRLGFIRSARALGLSLGEIRGIIALSESGQAPCSHVLGLLRARTAEISRTIRELQVLEAELNRLVERAHDINPTDCDPQRVCHLIGAT